MTKARKVELLYSKAKGQRMDASPEELKELRKYRVDSGEVKFVLTKANISAYISAVDRGSMLSFYDWCMNNGKADRRRRNSSEADIAAENHYMGIGAMLMGWLTWGLAIYWLLGERVSTEVCVVIGAVVSWFVWRVSRKYAFATLFLLPIFIMVLVARK